jgi:hypothetical protein
MKKLALLAGVAFVMSLTSCKHDYTCECTISGQTTTATYTKLSKSEADDTKKVCDNANSAATAFGGSCKWAKK